MKIYSFIIGGVALLLSSGSAFSQQTYSESSPSIREFSAILNGKKVDLAWKAYNPMGINAYVIERSKDGKEFETVVTVKTGGQSIQQLNYFEIDVKPEKGTAYYRVKQVASNGSTDYSNMIPVYYSRRAAKKDIILNPVGDKGQPLTADLIDPDAPTLLVLRDSEGNEYYAKAKIRKHGKRLIGAVYDYGDLKPGTYIVMASSNDAIYSRKITIR